MEKNICRLCSKGPIIGHSLLDNELATKLQSLTLIKILPDDIYSTVSCVECMHDLDNAYNIQQRILKVNAKLFQASLDDVDIKINKVEVKDEVIVSEEDNEYMHDVSTYNSICEEKMVEILPNNYEHIEKAILDSLPDLSENDKADVVAFSVFSENLTRADVVKNLEKNFINCNQLGTDQNVHSKTCFRCGAQFSNKKCFQYHMSAHLLNDKRLTDPLQIQNSTKLADALQVKKSPDSVEHKESVSTKNSDGQSPNQRPLFKCVICRQTFLTEEQFKKHVDNACPICEGKYKKCMLRKHLKTHCPSDYVCKLCGHALFNQKGLITHMRKRHDLATYSCDECGTKFHKGYTFLSHSKGTKEYVCTTCFNKQTKLKGHR